MTIMKGFFRTTALLVLCTAALLFIPPLGAAATGSDSVTITGYILPHSVPVADFSASPAAGLAPLTVQFMDLSSGSPAEWAWDFDNDGVTDSSAQDPSFIYFHPGSYAVTLRVTSAAGSDTETKPGFITVMSTNPADRIAALRMYVGSLTEPPWSEWILEVPLRNAGRLVEKGNENASVNQIRSFTDRVRTLCWLGIVSGEEAEYMSTEADAIIALIRA
jgi:PKD repeat protein